MDLIPLAVLVLQHVNLDTSKSAHLTLLLRA